jgi:proliferating cell nuclear antigen PCNA
MSTIDKKENMLFEAQTGEAYTVKILGELLNNTLKKSPIRFNEKGIFLLKEDTKNEQMIELSLLAENFIYYTCNKPICVEVNSQHLYKMLKCIKKKDTITLFIKDEEDLKLGISIEHPEEKNNRLINYVKVLPVRYDDIERPTGYPSPIIMSSKDFQRMKTLHNFSDNIEVTCKSKYLKFFCDGGELFQKEFEVGNKYYSDGNADYSFKQNFRTIHITGLTRCAVQSGNIQVFLHEDIGMKIKIKAGNLGEIIVYIKSLEMIEDEEEEKIKNKSNEDDDDNSVMDLPSEDEEEKPKKTKKTKK